MDQTMANPSTIGFISQVKLGELKHQRSVLLETYDRLSKESAQKEPIEALKSLRNGLEKIKVAGTPLHSDLGNLDLLVQRTTPSPGLIGFWRSRLESELATGRLRADIVYLFGALLDEWGAQESASQKFLDERRTVHAELL